MGDNRKFWNSCVQYTTSYNGYRVQYSNFALLTWYVSSKKSEGYLAQLTTWHKSIGADITYEVPFFLNHLVSFDHTIGYLSFRHVELMCHMYILYWKFPREKCRKLNHHFSQIGSLKTSLSKPLASLVMNTFLEIKENVATEKTDMAFHSTDYTVGFLSFWHIDWFDVSHTYVKMRISPWKMLKLNSVESVVSNEVIDTLHISVMYTFLRN